MSRREYKTVAMPQLLKARRRRGQTRAEMVAEIVSLVINKQAGMGWRYVGTDSFRTVERRGLLGGAVETVYTVLVFDREVGEGEFDEDRHRREAPPAPPGARRRDDLEPEETVRRAAPYRFGDGAVSEAIESVRRRPNPAEGARAPRRPADGLDDFDGIGDSDPRLDDFDRAERPRRGPPPRGRRKF